MPAKKTVQRARKAKRQGKSASTQAGEFVHDEIKRIRKGKHGARSAKQAIAIGLSEARRAGVKAKAPKKGKASEAVRKKAQSDLKRGASQPNKKPSAKRSAASTRALKRESTRSASKTALSRQAKKAAKKRTKSERSASARKGARTRAKKSK